ncbi:N-6 DNA methylase [Micromonospora sp. RP3T]|uniref:N-6 DNA methylase n=1 Tax=Micromonospora sp. RP3T TaxID=2135446 RepID=UPI000D16C41F|nr:N-6 DNA methylase [Micromonospora sp. RP3T]PTA42484.1 SAM-dependent methyltransferase [Micromonospora sp. RP3T]
MTTQADPLRGQTTLTASGIARLANVGRAAVSNWRRRYADFPAPVGGTPSSPSFDAREVEHWLLQHGRLHQADAGERAWQHIESYQPAAEMTDALVIAGTYLLVRQQGESAEGVIPDPKQLVGSLRTLDKHLADMVGQVLPSQWTPQLAAVLHAVKQLATEQAPEAAFEYLHNRYVTSASSMSGLAGTPDSVAEVMLALAGAGTEVFDFTSGTGSLLRMAADKALRAGSGVRCSAQEIKPQYALITLLRLWFVQLRAQQAGIASDPPVVHVGDSLLADAFTDLRADVVVANFPFGIHDWGHDRLAYDPRWAYGLPPRTEPELAWVQHALAHLAPGGTAVVLMPPAAALRPAGRRVRAELVRRGALRAVVALPAGLMPPTGIGLHIWVLTQPDPQAPPTNGLLVIDTTAAPPGRTLLDTVGPAWRAYLSGEPVDEPGVCRTVPVIETLDDQVDLTPQRYLPRTGTISADPDEIIRRIRDFERLLDELRDYLPPVQEAQAAPLRAAPHADIADLIRSGSISMLRTASRRQPSRSAVTSSVLTTTDIVSGSPASGSTSRDADDVPPLVQAGDILMPTIGSKVHARVATREQIGAALGPGVQLIRVDKTRFDPWFIAGVLSRTDNLRVAGRASTGSVRIDVKRLAIPVLPLHQQQAYGEAFRKLVAFRTALAEGARAGATLAQEVGDNLFGGSLELPDIE